MRGRTLSRPLASARAYFEALTELVDVEALRGFSGTLVHDAMGGAGAGWLTGFLKYAKLKIPVHEVHAVPNPTFYGVPPRTHRAELSLDAGGYE